ncbi:LOW QUALITY PROTEIN: E3 ubiquitin/ISG15 ligase TRIM25-like [Aplochiton taeniatus]
MFDLVPAMATSSVLLSEEQVQCSICIEVFTKPVSTPCGHNYCMACITGYWDSGADVYQCPMCKETFTVRPELRVNTFISKMSSQFKKLPPVEVTSSTEQKGATPADVVFDYCTGAQSKAIKSCLVECSPYCETHLEPHQRVASLKKHKLIPPVENLEGLVCKKHDRPLELFCKEENTCICQFCTEGDHRNHHFVNIEEEVEKQLAQMNRCLQTSIQERKQKIKDLRESVKLGKKNTDKDVAVYIKAFTAMVHFINRSQTELLKGIEESQKAVEKQAWELH